MKKEKEANKGASQPLADTPEERIEQYDAALRTIERFENQYNTYAVGQTKVTVWRDENGAVNRIEEQLSQQEKARLELARMVKTEYEEKHMQEYLDANWGLAPYEEQRESEIVTEIDEMRKSDQRKGDRLAAFNRSAADDERQTAGPEKEVSDIREAKLERAFERLAKFELQAAPALTSRSGNEKHTVSFRGDGTISASIEEIGPSETRELDEALAIVREMELTDMDMVDEVETRVFDRAKEEIGNRDPSEAEAVEKLQYVRDLESSVSETFGSFEEAVDWEREEFGDDAKSRGDELELER